MDYVEHILAQCRMISWSFSEVKKMKKECCILFNRVMALEKLVQDLQQKGSGSMTPNLTTALHRLDITLIKAEDLIKKCTKTRPLSFLYKSEFKRVNERLRDTFVVLSSLPHMNQGATLHQGFFLDDDDDWEPGFGQAVPMGSRGAMAPVLARRPFKGAAPWKAMHSAGADMVCHTVVTRETSFKLK